eukprot:TRINITY_DN6625_c0_g1_i5.p1 TRINITY_DN6625_c0_g1~~TRINITY_DN6625_c0_g1_i5.p1  ORF type:complete len:532 (+),score=87.58 TRINITY_DN6625_c0_g1_i5:47-1642(+)
MIKNEQFKTENVEFEKLVDREHESHLLSYFAGENVYRDCIIQSQNGYFLCHKLILAASNSFFKQILQPFDPDEPVFVLMVDYQTQDVQEMLSAAYKHDFQSPELKKLFFFECKPFQLEQLNVESVKIREDILESIKLQNDVKEPKELIEVEPIILKEESQSPSHEIFFDTDFPMGGEMEDNDWFPEEKKKKKTKLKGTKMKKKKKKQKKKEQVTEESLKDDNETLNNSHEPDPEEKENVNSDLVKNEDDPKLKKKKKPRIPKSAYPVPCTTCGKQLKNSVMKSKHEKRCGVSKKGPNICHLCGASFKFTSSLNHHLSINCENSCKICGQVFKTRFAQKDHLFYAHGQVVAKRPSPVTKKELEERFQCDQCDKIYAKKYSLLMHVKKAHEGSDVASFQCTECGKTMGTERSLTIHMSLHKPPEMPCPMCGKLFHNKKYLDRHARQVHTQQQDMKYKCEICGRGFAVKRHAEEHRNVHLNLKPFKCRWCDRVYQNAANKNAHERTSHREAYLSSMSSGYRRIQVKKSDPLADE